jgi:predicted GIY-YIG superfamily endonuclease
MGEFMKYKNIVEIYILVKKNTNFYKIGISSNIDKRFIQLDTHPEEIDIIATYECENRDKALELESLIHNILKNYSIRKEWFNLDFNELQIVDNLLVDILRLKPNYFDRMYLVDYNHNKESKKSLTELLQVL